MRHRAARPSKFNSLFYRQQSGAPVFPGAARATHRFLRRPERPIAKGEPVAHMHDAPNRRGATFSTSRPGPSAAVGAALAAWPFIDQMNPVRAVLALASIEVDISAIQVGQQVVFKWRGHPLFVRRRTPKEIAEAARGTGVRSARSAGAQRQSAGQRAGHRRQPRASSRNGWSDRRLHPSGLHADARRSKAITAAGSAIATARNTTPPDASAKVPRRRTWRFRLIPSCPTPRIKVG